MNSTFVKYGLIILIGLTALPAHAGGFDSAIERLSKEVVKYMGQKNKSVVSVKEFVGPPNTAVGQGLAKKLESELKGKGLEVVDSGLAIKPGDTWTVSGRFSIRESGGVTKIKVNTEIFDEDMNLPNGLQCASVH